MRVVMERFIYKGEDGYYTYVVKENEDMFDVCRALRVRPEQIEEQNGNKTSVQAGDKIFVYLPKSVDF